MPHTPQNMDTRNQDDVYTRMLDAQVSAIKVHLREEYNNKLKELEKGYEDKIAGLQEQITALFKDLKAKQGQIDHLIEASRKPVHRGVQPYKETVSTVSVKTANSQNDTQAILVTVRKLLET